MGSGATNRIHLHSEKEVTIWCAIGIIGPNFF